MANPIKCRFCDYVVAETTRKPDYEKINTLKGHFKYCHPEEWQKFLAHMRKYPPKSVKHLMNI